MAKEEKMDRLALTFEEFVKRSPKLTILKDQPLATEQIKKLFEYDPFNFRYKLGPVFDILRYGGKGTESDQMPIAILITGDWGTGKTTAMKWLEVLLQEWNSKRPDKVPAKDYIKVHPVWFYPWKYDNKEDVRRGLIASVIINAVYIINPQNKKITINRKNIITGLKLMGSFGLNVISDLASASEYEIPFIPGLSISGDALKDIKKHYTEAAHPEAAFLNEFEEAMKYWVKESLGKKQRLVIFIDDLDRCMPEIGLQVLEAIKLYLNIPNLIFVLGVDKNVVEKLVIEHYKKLGLLKEKEKDVEETEDEKRDRIQAERKARQYLCKMFQTEIELAPSEKQINNFLEQNIKDISLRDTRLTKSYHQQLFKKLILKFARRNPREVKRQLNNALIAGAGTEMIAVEKGEQHPTFEQGLQLYFIHEILKSYTQIADMINTDLGRKFFKDWADIAIAYKDMPEKVKYPGPEVGSETDIEQIEQNNSFSKMLVEKDSTYDVEKYIKLLDDPDLRALMQIPFSRKLAEFTSWTPLVITTQAAEAIGLTDEVNVVVTPKRPSWKDYIIIRDAVARQLNKVPDELTDDDYRKTVELNVSDSGISDLILLKRLPNLQKLFVGGTHISDIGILRYLTSLKWLSLRETQVSDITVLAGLTMLQDLNLFGTKVTNIDVLSGLSNLQVLSLAGTQVSDIGVLSGLINLQELSISRTLVTDIGPLKGLLKLRRLYLHHTRAGDISPLTGITGLQALDLSTTYVNKIDGLASLTDLQVLSIKDTQVSDIGVLSGLTKLNALYLSGTAISDLQPLRNLVGLKDLLIHGTSVSDLEPLRNLTDLVRLGVARTDISDLESLENLIHLQALDLSETNISDFGSLKNLTSLQRLYLSGTRVADIDVLSSLINMQELFLHETSVSNLDSLRHLTTLVRLGVNHTSVSDLASLENLNRLQALDLNNTKVSDLEPLKNLSDLRRLYLSDTQVSDIGVLASFANLQNLELCNTKVIDISPLFGLKELQSLKLSGTPVSDEQVDKLQKVLPKLEIRW